MKPWRLEYELLNNVQEIVWLGHFPVNLRFTLSGLPALTAPIIPPYSGSGEERFFEGFAVRWGKSIETNNDATKRHLNWKKIMKTKNLLAIIGAVAFAAITINVNASDALLSPRAAGNEIKKVSSMNHDPNLVNMKGFAVSPRAAGNRFTRYAGTNNDVNPATACAKNMNGSPKAVSECTSHTTMPACNSMAVTSAN